LNKRPIILCLALCLMTGIIFTWPLAPEFFSSIPYTVRPIPGFERVPLMPGDHLQTYYWFWLLSDNLFGHSALFTNPYEFNGPSGPMSTVYANFPYSLLYITLLFLGPVGAYNGLILLSFMLCGLAMFLLARSWTKDFWASLMAGLVFTFAPFRVSHIAGGQLPGYVIFLLPLCLYFIERTLITGRWWYGWAGGLCLVLLSLMDPHTSFLAALTLGIYLPSRILLFQPFPLSQAGETRSFWPGFFGAFIGGLSISFLLWIRFVIRDGPLFLTNDLLQPLLLGMVSIVVLWLYLSACLARLTTLSFPEARHLVGKSFFFFLPLWVYALKYQVPIPRLGLILIVFCLSLFILFLLIQWRKQRDRLLSFDRRRIIPVLVGTGLGLTLAASYLLHIRTTVFLPSLAGKGRTLSEVLLFSPRIGNLFFWQDINQEKFILIGWGLVLMAALGLLLLLRRHARDPGLSALAGILAFLGVVLALGPRLISFPIYEILYRYFPFFSYSRVPSRFVFVGLIFLCLLAAVAISAVREGLTSRGWKRLSQWFPILVIFLIAAEYHTWQSLGISIMPKDNMAYSRIQKGLPDGKRVLELPIWPGDSHQSSAYEYTVTRTRKPMINGYAPVVVRDYIQQVFWPLFPLDFGELKETQAEKLKELNVDLITFHDNPFIFPEKISPFPPRLTLKRLMASRHLKLVDHDQDVFLFKFNSSFPESLPEHQNPPRPPLIKGGVKTPPLEKGDRGGFNNGSNISSPVSAVFYAQNLPRETGRLEFDHSASGYYLLMNEQHLNQGRLVPRQGVEGNVVSASPGRDQPGYLVVGAYRVFPSGKYRARFRIKAGVADPLQEVGRIEIIKDRKAVIKQRTIRARDMNGSTAWTDIPLEFENLQSGEIGFRVYFSGKVVLQFNTAIIGFAGQDSGPGAVEAEELFRQTGYVSGDPLASGKEAVFAKAGFHPPVYLCYGPYRTLEEGNYKADFSLRLKAPPSIPKETKVALLEVATDMGKRILGKRLVQVKELRADAYQPMGVVFKVPFRCEVGYRLKFLDKADLLIDRIEVGSSQETRSER
jgi:hypothetical protein